MALERPQDHTEKKYMNTAEEISSPISTNLHRTFSNWFVVEVKKLEISQLFHDESQKKLEISQLFYDETQKARYKSYNGKDKSYV